MKLCVLVDNNTLIDRYYCGEPAVSYYIKTDGLSILFDTGYSELFLKNAQKMNIDLHSLTHVVLSHGHNDHSNGLRHLAERMNCSALKLISHPDCLIPKYCEGDFIGSPLSPDEAAEHFCYMPTKAPLWLSESCVFLGEIPVCLDFEPRQPIGTRHVDGAEASDMLLDDSALACKTTQGLFIITGCSHSGICNIIEFAKKVCGESRIAGVIGGFHLFAEGERLRATADYMSRMVSGTLYPCHCVSLRAKTALMRRSAVQEVGVGLTIEL